MTKESRERRALRREAKEYRMLARHAGEDMRDIDEEMGESPAEYKGVSKFVTAMEEFNKPNVPKEELDKLAQLAQSATSLVSSMERFNRASQQRQEATMARASAMGITPYRLTMEGILQKLERFRKESLAAEKPAEPAGIETQPVAEFFGGGFYMVGSNTEPIAIYQISNTPMGIELKTGALYA